MVCLDTHALLWWALDPEKLSEKALGFCAQMERAGGYASSISIWEIGLKIKRGHLDIGISVERFVAGLKQTGVIELVPVTEMLWMANLALDWAHRDPADRTIVATAIGLGVPLLTRDETIHAYPPARAVW